MEQRSVKESVSDFLVSWNAEFGDRYPITNRMMEEHYLSSSYKIENLSYALYQRNMFVGLFLVKEAKDILPSYDESFFISLLYVDKKFRRNHIAKEMISKLIKEMSSYQKKRIYLGSDMECFYPGVFVFENEATHLAIKRLGFEKVYNSYNLVSNQDVRLVLNQNIKLATTETETEKEEVLKFIKENFSYRWYVDCKKQSPHNFLYLKEQNEIIGFVRIVSTKDAFLSNGLNTYMRYKNLFAIGPLGIKDDYHHLGYGKEIVQSALNHAFQQGASDCLVDWTGLVEFYKKCGFQEVCDTFTLYEFTLEKGEEQL